MWTAALLGASLSLSAAVDAAPSDDDEGEEVEVLDVAQCPSLFGPDWAHEANSDYRSVRLHEVAITDKRVEITHGVGRWSKPKPMRVPGLELIGVERPDAEPGEEPPGEDERVALVELTEAFGDLCPHGIYAVSVDDALGRNAKVLDIDDRGVLVERAGALAYLPWEGHPLPKSVRMVWRSSYDVVLDASGASAGKSSKAAKKKKRRKRPKKKARKKKR